MILNLRSRDHHAAWLIPLIRSGQTNGQKITNGQIPSEWPLLDFGHSPIRILAFWRMAVAIRQFWILWFSEWPFAIEYIKVGLTSKLRLG